MRRLDDPDSVEAAFYQAFERCDQQAMTRLWLDAQDSSCIHPGGPLLQGTEAVLESWGQIFSQARPPQVGYRLLNRLQAAGLAVHTVEESIRPGDGESDATVLIATNVYRQTPEGWRMAAHHASLPMMGQRQSRRGPVH